MMFAAETGITRIRGMVDGERIVSWHGRVTPNGHANPGFINNVSIYTSARRKYRVGVDVNGELYAREGRVTPKYLLLAETTETDAWNDLHFYHVHMTQPREVA